MRWLWFWYLQYSFRRRPSGRVSTGSSRSGLGAQKFSGPGERGIHVRAKIRATQTVKKACPFKRKERLHMWATENQVLLPHLEFLLQVLQSFEAGRIQRQHIPHSEDEHLGLLPSPVQGGFELVCRAEEQRSEDAK